MHFTGGPDVRSCESLIATVPSSISCRIGRVSEPMDPQRLCILTDETPVWWSITKYCLSAQSQAKFGRVLLYSSSLEWPPTPRSQPSASDGSSPVALVAVSYRVLYRRTSSYCILVVASRASVYFFKSRLRHWGKIGLRLRHEVEGGGVRCEGGTVGCINRWTEYV